MSRTSAWAGEARHSLPPWKPAVVGLCFGGSQATLWRSGLRDPLRWYKIISKYLTTTSLRSKAFNEAASSQDISTTFTGRIRGSLTEFVIKSASCSGTFSVPYRLSSSVFNDGTFSPTTRHGVLGDIAFSCLCLLWTNKSLMAFLGFLREILILGMDLAMQGTKGTWGC